MLKTTPKDKNYPEQLNRLNSPPKQLFINPDNWKNLLSKPMIAVVGSRRSSAYGAAVYYRLAKEATKRDVVIVKRLSARHGQYCP